MRNLFTRRAKLRWLECEIERIRSLWHRLGRLYWRLHAQMLNGTTDPSVPYRVHIAADRAFFYLQQLGRALKWHQEAV